MDEARLNEIKEKLWEKIEFQILLEPKAQERARDHLIKTKDGRVWNHKYKSKAQSLYEMQLGAFICQHRPDGPLKGPILLEIQAFFEVPVSRPKKFHAAADRGEVWPEGKPDLDNVLKQFCDVATKVLFVDDAQIVDVRISKHYGSPARWQITLWYRKDRQGGN